MFGFPLWAVKMNIPETPRFYCCTKKSSYISHQSLLLICRPTACTTHKVVVLFLFLSVFSLGEWAREGPPINAPPRNMKMLRAFRALRILRLLRLLKLQRLVNIAYDFISSISVFEVDAGFLFLRHVSTQKYFCHCFIFWLFESTYEKNLSGPAFCSLLLGGSILEFLKAISRLVSQQTHAESTRVQQGSATRRQGTP